MDISKLITHSDPNFQDLQCMSYTSKGTHELLVGGGQSTMFKVDVEKGEITQMVRPKPPLVTACG
jgi:hypothetical protein